MAALLSCQGEIPLKCVRENRLHSATRHTGMLPRHGHVTVVLGAMLLQHVRSNDLGQVWTEVGFRLASNPDTVRAPDLAFVRKARLPSKDATGFYRGAPDLAIEVLSPDETQSEVREKIDDYVAAGTPVVVIVDPDAQRATVHRAGAAVVAAGPNDTLDLGDVVAGFTLPLSEVFE